MTRRELATMSAVVARESGRFSMPRPLGSSIDVSGILVWGMVKRNRCQVIAIISLFDGGRHLLVSTSRRLGVRAEWRSRVAIRPSRSDAALDRREPGARLEVETGRCRWRHEDDFRGEPALDAISRRRLVFGWSIGTSTMMHACASGAKLRGGGANLGRRAGHVFHPITATSDVVGRLLGCRTVNGVGFAEAAWSGTGRTQLEALRHLAGRYQPPQGDEQLTRQRHDHGFARGAAAIGGAGGEPAGEPTLLLEDQRTPDPL